jgi:hypothetical protein
MFYAFAGSYSTPVVYQFSTGIEQHLGTNRKLSLAYVGSQSRHLPALQQLTDRNKNFIRQTSVVEVRSEGESFYNSFQTQFNQRVTMGIHVLGSLSRRDIEGYTSPAMFLRPMCKMLVLATQAAELRRWCRPPSLGGNNGRNHSSAVSNGVHSQRSHGQADLGGSCRLSARRHRRKSIWIQESYSKVVTVPWYTTTSIGYTYSRWSLIRLNIRDSGDW